MQKITKKLKVKLNNKEVYKTYIKTKSMKKLNKSKILRANILLERVFIDFWGPHLKGISRASVRTRLQTHVLQANCLRVT